MEDEAYLVGDRAPAGGAVGGELHLVHLDQVLGLAADAIDVLVEVLRLKELERENLQLRRAVTDLTLEYTLTMPPNCPTKWDHLRPRSVARLMSADSHKPTSRHFPRA